MSGAVLLGGGTTAPPPMLLGTVVATTTGTTVSVLLDGSTVPSQAIVPQHLQWSLCLAPYAPTTGAIDPAIGARVMGMRVGSTFYISQILSGGRGDIKPFVHIDGTGGHVTATGGAPGTKIVEGWGTPESYDAVWDTTNSQVVIGTAGRYALLASVSMPSNSTGQRTCTVWKNGAQLTGKIESASGTANSVTVIVAINLRLAATDTIYISCSQNSGVSLTTNGSSIKIWRTGP